MASPQLIATPLTRLFGIEVRARGEKGARDRCSPPAPPRALPPPRPLR